MSEPRPARPQDAQALRDPVRAAHAVCVPRIGREPAPIRDDCAARIAAGQARILEQDGTALGARLLDDEPEAPLLCNVAVAPAAQGRGIGRRPIAFTGAEARRRALLRLHTNGKMAENATMHPRLGFAETRRGGEAGHIRDHFEKRL